MDIQDNSVVTDVDTEILDGEITQISNDFSETYYFDGEQEEELEMLVAKAMKLGELYERKKWQAAKAQADQKIKLLLCDEHLKKCESPTGVFNSQYPDEEPCLICLAKEAKAQAVPEGFVLVPKEPTDKTIAHMINTPIEVNLLCDHADVFLSEGEAYIAYQAMIEAQEPAND